VKKKYILNEMVHNIALDGKGRESQVSENRHFEDFYVSKNRNRIMPFCLGPVVPKLPEKPAYDSGEE
jgi:hypothetical protein